MAPEIKTDGGLGWNLLDWGAGIVLIYSLLFGVGKIILGSTWTGLGLLVLAVPCFLFIRWDLNRRGWQTFGE